MAELKIFELRFNKDGEKAWVAAYTNINAVWAYCSQSDCDLIDFDENDEVVEIPREEWGKLSVTNNDYGDGNDWKAKTFEEWMKDVKSPEIIAGTAYN